MLSPKDLWLSEHERLYAEASDWGYTDEEAMEYADEHADDAARDRLADLADEARMRGKGE